MKKQIIVVGLVGMMLLGSILLPMTGCANRGVGPQGGPKDSLAPEVVKMTIPNGARNVKEKEITIHFNEYIQLNGSTDNILVSPPQQRPPEIKAVGKRLSIKFQEDLIDSTTYTIDFGDQIVDNNEKNPIHDYSYSFSTGDQIDSLEVYGQLINAEDLNPISNVVIGLHQVMDDSVIYHQPFTRIGRTNAEGEFAIRNVKAGTYRLYALQDQSRDYCFQAGEGMAFMDEPVTPYITTETLTDTIYLPDTLDANGLPIADSIYTAEYFYYEPSNLLLRFFMEDYSRLYFQRVVRKEAHLIQFFFNGEQPQTPQFKALRLDSDSLGTDSTWVDVMEHCLLQASAKMDTFQLWLTDSLAIGMDTIRLSMTYWKTDSLYVPQLQTDTILAVYRAPRLSERTLKNLQQKREQAGLLIRCPSARALNYFDTLLIQSPTPIARFYQDSIHVLLRKDTLLTPVRFTAQLRDSTSMDLMILTKWNPDQNYQVKLDSGAITDVYNLANKKTDYAVKVRSTDEYATMTVFVEPFEEKAMIQILNDKDKPVRTARAQKEGTEFLYLEPGAYYMRIFMDENGDEEWTTGEFKTHRQPEEVYYFHKKLTLRANWTFEEHFNWQAIDLLQQKPAAIRVDPNKSK